MLLVCAALRWAAWIPTPVDLPSGRGAIRFTRHWLNVHLTRDGEIVYRDRVVSLAELSKGLADRGGEPEAAAIREIYPDSTRRPILLCIDRKVLVLHATWLFHAVGKAGFNRIHVGVRGPAGPTVLPMTLVTDWWALPSESPSESSWSELGAALLPDDVGMCSLSVEEDSIAGPDLRAYVDDWRRKWKRQPIAKIQVKTSIPFQRVVDAFAMARVGGFLFIEWGHQFCPPWIEGRKRLPQPEPEDAYVLFSLSPPPWGGSDLSQPDTGAVLLPVASHADRDRDDDPDDRLVLNLDQEGRLLYRDMPRSLDQIIVILSEKRRFYNLQQRAKGKSGFIEIAGHEYTRLFALVRAHKDAPWQHVAWLLAALSAESFYKVQLAAVLVPDDRYDIEESRRLGALGHRGVRTTTWHLDGKLRFSLLEPEESTPLRIAEDGAYRLADKETRELETLHGWLKNARGPIRVSPDAATECKFVVAAVNQIKRADRAFVFEFGLLPPANVMRRPTLPMPR